MYIFENNILTIPAGDSAEIKITLTLTFDGSPYILLNDEELELDILNPRDNSTVGTGRGREQTAQGTVTVFIPRSATEQVKGSYKGLVRLCNVTKRTADVVIGYLQPLTVRIV